MPRDRKLPRTTQDRAWLAKKMSKLKREDPEKPNEQRLAIALTEFSKYKGSGAT